METNELISKLRDISNMRSASYFKRTICKMAAQKLETQQARIAELEAELKEERYRHDRVQDFEVAEAQVLAKLREERRWIPVGERLPEPGRIVLVHQIFSWEKFEDGAEVTIGRLRPVPPDKKPYWEFQHYRPDFRNGTIMDNDIICPGSEYVTHWMPLPELPEEKAK